MIPFEARSIEVDLEQAAAESEQDRRDHRKLAGDVAELLAHEGAMYPPDRHHLAWMTRRMRQRPSDARRAT